MKIISRLILFLVALACSDDSYCHSEPVLQLSDEKISRLESVQFDLNEVPEITADFVRHFTERLESEAGLSLQFHLPSRFAPHFSAFLNSSTNECLGVDRDYDEDNPFATMSLLDSEMSALNVMLRFASFLAPCVIEEKDDILIIVLRE